MSLFFHHRCLGEQAPTTAVAWSTRVNSLLAVGFSNGIISFFHADGTPVASPRMKVQRSVAPTVMSWGPAPNHYLAVGWQDGCVSLWDENKMNQTDESTVHAKADIRLVVWSPDGTRLITGCSKGVICVWKYDLRMNLSVVTQLRKDGTISHCVLRLPHIPDASGGFPPPPVGCPQFIFGGETGSVFLADDKGVCKLVCDQRAPISMMLYNAARDQVAIVTTTMVLSVHQLKDDGTISQLGLDVKLSATSQDAGSKLRGVWAGHGLLATVAHESLIRVWDVANDDSYVLALSDVAPGDAAAADKLTCIAFDADSGTLAVGSLEGRVLLWRRVGGREATGAADWTPLAPVGIGSRVQQVVWGASEDLLAVRTTEAASILAQAAMQRRVKCSLAVIQASPTRLIIEKTDTMGASVPIELESRLPWIKGMDLTRNHVVVWSGSAAEIYELSHHSATLIGEFASPAKAMAIHNEVIIPVIPNSNDIQLMNIDRTASKQVISIGPSEGKPTLVDVCENYLAVFTSESVLKVFHLGGREMKTIVAGRRFDQGETKTHDAISIRINANCTRVSIVGKCCDPAHNTWIRDSRIYVYHIENDIFEAYDFGGQGRVPTGHAWDPIDPRLIAVQTLSLKLEASKADEIEFAVNPYEITCIFSTPDMGMRVQDTFPILPSEHLLGVQVPYVFLASKDPSEGRLRLKRRTMRDFVGMEKEDETTRNALLDFSYKLATGNMDEAYRAVKALKSESVWSSMAEMCVKTKRIDVAEACLGNMGNARGARCLRLARQEPEVEAAIAMVAIQLGKTEEAERLYRECGRFDLLNRLYQSIGDWKRAAEVAEKKDRMHLKTTRFVEAEWRESIGDIEAARRCYELAGRATEVPRMLWEQGAVDQLEVYARTNQDKTVLKWWASYLESKGNLDAALDVYRRGNDIRSIVRIHCHRKEFAKAEAVVEETGDVLASYHLALQYQNSGKVSDAIRLFGRSGRFQHAALIARETGNKQDLLALSLRSPPRVMLESAAFFESEGMLEQAVLLYQKAGNVKKAIALCFEGRLFDALRQMADDVTADTDPAILAKMAQFLVENEQFEKACHLLVISRQFEQALNLAAQRNIQMTEDFAEKISNLLPSKEENERERNRILQLIAKVAKKQGNFSLATKKFTQAGLKTKAMKALLRSGDTEKIIFFAGVLKQPEIYVMAANYLQNLDWHANPEIMKAIQSFYTKAKAYVSLASFFDSCSQVEIDEFRDYDKALAALKEAHKYATKGTTHEAVTKAEELEQRIRYVEAFVGGRKLAATNPGEMISVCHRLLEIREAETAIRIGDVFALLIEWFFTQKDYRQAYQMIEKMRERRIMLGPYLDQSMVEQIYAAVGIDTRSRNDTVDDDIGEEIG